jgi:hypothetical protein
VPGYRNRFLDLARLGAVAEGAAEAFFRSEIRRRLAVTALLIVLSRVGYFVPLPGFDRRLIPDSYLSFAPLPAGSFVPPPDYSLLPASCNVHVRKRAVIAATYLQQIVIRNAPSSMQMTSLISPLN